jgi:hypothetical protein
MSLNQSRLEFLHCVLHIKNGMLKIVSRFPYSEKVVKLSVACACCVFVGCVCRSLCLADSVWRIFLPLPVKQTRMKGGGEDSLSKPL